MSKVNRREAIGGILAAGAGVLTFSDQTLSQTTLSPALAWKHQPKPMAFDAAKHRGIADELIRSHL